MDLTLALGGGGVKGFAHVGVLRVLEREGFHVTALAGTSAGGMMGALYAAGYSPDELEKLLSQMDQSKLYHRLRDDGPSLLGLSGVIHILEEALGERTFADVRIPLAVTATDLHKGLPVVLREGRLVDAVLATSAVPGVFPPRHVDGLLLVDGGVLDPVPVALARSLAPCLPVVAVVLSPPIGWKGDEQKPAHARTPRLLVSLPLITQLASRLRLAQAFNIFLRSIDAAGMMLTDLRLKVERPEVIIRPQVHHFGLIDEVDVSELVRLGETATIEALPEIRRAVSWVGKIRRRMAQSGAWFAGYSNGA